MMADLVEPGLSAQIVYKRASSSSGGINQLPSVKRGPLNCHKIAKRLAFEPNDMLACLRRVVDFNTLAMRRFVSERREIEKMIRKELLMAESKEEANCFKQFIEQFNE